MLPFGRRKVFFLSAKGSSITDGPLILEMLEASYLPTQTAVMHCKGHRLLSSPVAQGNAFADRIARESSLQTPNISPALFPGPTPFTPSYSQTQEPTLMKQSAIGGPEDGCLWENSTVYLTLRPRLYSPIYKIFFVLLPATYTGSDSSSFSASLVSSVMQACSLCTKASLQGRTKPPPSFKPHGHRGFPSLELTGRLSVPICPLTKRLNIASPWWTISQGGLKPSP